MSLLSVLTLSNRSNVISELPALWSSYDGNLPAYFTVHTLTIATILLILINYGKNKSVKSALNRVPHPRGIPLLGNLIEILTTKSTCGKNIFSLTLWLHMVLFLNHVHKIYTQIYLVHWKNYPEKIVLATACNWDQFRSCFSLHLNLSR